MSEKTGASGPRSRLGPIALVALLVASLVAGIYVYRARTPDLALEVIEFDRQLDGGKATFEFFVRFDEPDATVEVVGRDQVITRTLAESIELEDGQRVTCLWDGRDDSGDYAEMGRYRLRVTLPGQDRVMVFPRRLTIEEVPFSGGYQLDFSDEGSCEPGEES